MNERYSHARSAPHPGPCSCSAHGGDALSPLRFGDTSARCFARRVPARRVLSESCRMVRRLSHRGCANRLSGDGLRRREWLVRDAGIRVPRSDLRLHLVRRCLVRAPQLRRLADVGHVARRTLRSRSRPDWRTFGPLLGALLGGVSAAFLVSNGSFYLLSGYFSETSWTEYAARVAKYYPPYLSGTLLYVALAALVHALVAARARSSQRV